MLTNNKFLFLVLSLASVFSCTQEIEDDYVKLSKGLNIELSVKNIQVNVPTKIIPIVTNTDNWSGQIVESDLYYTIQTDNSNVTISDDYDFAVDKYSLPNDALTFTSDELGTLEVTYAFYQKTNDQLAYEKTYTLNIVDDVTPTTSMDRIGTNTEIVNWSGMVWRDTVRLSELIRNNNSQNTSFWGGFQVRFRYSTDNTNVGIAFSLRKISETFPYLLYDDAPQGGGSLSDTGRYNYDLLHELSPPIHFGFHGNLSDGLGAVGSHEFRFYAHCINTDNSSELNSSELLDSQSYTLRIINDLFSLQMSSTNEQFDREFNLNDNTTNGESRDFATAVSEQEIPSDDHLHVKLAYEGNKIMDLFVGNSTVPINGNNFIEIRRVDFSTSTELPIQYVVNATDTGTMSNVRLIFRQDRRDRTSNSILSSYDTLEFGDFRATRWHIPATIDSVRFIPLDYASHYPWGIANTIQINGLNANNSSSFRIYTSLANRPFEHRGDFLPDNANEIIDLNHNFHFYFGGRPTELEPGEEYLDNTGKDTCYKYKKIDYYFRDRYYPSHNDTAHDITIKIVDNEDVVVHEGKGIVSLPREDAPKKLMRKDTSTTRSPSCGTPATINSVSFVGNSNAQTGRVWASGLNIRFERNSSRLFRVQIDNSTYNNISPQSRLPLDPDYELTSSRNFRYGNSTYERCNTETKKVETYRRKYWRAYNTTRRVIITDDKGAEVYNANVNFRLNQETGDTVINSRFVEDRCGARKALLVNVSYEYTTSRSSIPTTVYSYQYGLRNAIFNFNLCPSHGGYKYTGYTRSRTPTGKPSRAQSATATTSQLYYPSPCVYRTYYTNRNTRTATWYNNISRKHISRIYFTVIMYQSDIESLSFHYSSHTLEAHYYGFDTQYQGRIYYVDFPNGGSRENTNLSESVSYPDYPANWGTSIRGSLYILSRLSED